MVKGGLFLFVQANPKITVYPFGLGRGRGGRVQRRRARLRVLGRSQEKTYSTERERMVVYSEQMIFTPSFLFHSACAVPPLTPSPATSQPLQAAAYGTQNLAKLV